MIYYQINSVTDGKVQNYPKVIFIGLFKNKHWRDLVMSYDADDTAFDETLTAVFDDVIDFEKTGFVKTSSELFFPDRLKLFLFEMVQCRSETINLKYQCDKCNESFTNAISLLTLKEKKLRKKFEKDYLFPDDITVYLEMPKTIDKQKLTDIIRNYKVEVYEKIKKLKEDFDLEDLSEEDKVSLNKKSEKIKKDYYVSFDVEKINCYQDVDFDNVYTYSLITYYPFIKGIEFESFKKYLDYMNEATGTDKVFSNFVKKYDMGFDDKVTFECPKCHKKFTDSIPLEPKFFFT